MLVGLLAARSKTLKRLKADNPEKDEKTLASRLVAYSSGVSLFTTLKCFIIYSLKEMCYRPIAFGCGTGGTPSRRSRPRPPYRRSTSFACRRTPVGHQGGHSQWQNSVFRKPNFIIDYVRITLIYFSGGCYPRDDAFVFFR